MGRFLACMREEAHGKLLEEDKKGIGTRIGTWKELG